MSVSYQYIRVDRSLVVPATSIFNDNGDTVNILCPGFDTPFPCGGEIAEGLRMFLEGTRSFRVTPNGVLDVYGSLVENLNAQRVFNGAPPLESVSDVIVDAGNYKQYQAQPGLHTTGPDAPAVIDVDKIARGIRSRPK